MDNVILPGEEPWVVVVLIEQGGENTLQCLVDGNDPTGVPLGGFVGQMDVISYRFLIPAARRNN